jgi:hypothetical protein
VYVQAVPASSCSLLTARGRPGADVTALEPWHPLG